ncbi:hypothetical protein BJ165DRAFT_1407153 [Panaeolus papilionaceus]|nr:hypothetical protein BJ165DRAFT_1407153 [Panaeolus papilionaceus]
MSSKDPIIAQMQKRMPTDIERRILESSARIRESRGSGLPPTLNPTDICKTNRVDILLYRTIVLRSVPQVHQLTQALVLKSRCSFQSHTFPALTDATHGLVLPTTARHADLGYLFSTLKGLKNLSWVPAWSRKRVGGDGGSDANTMQTRSGGVLPPGMLDKTRQLTLVDPLEEWATWDWKAIFATCQDGTKELEWRENYSMNLGDGDSQSPTENDIAPGKVCICCVKIAKPQGSETRNTPASDDPAKILRKKVFRGFAAESRRKTSTESST